MKLDVAGNLWIGLITVFPRTVWYFVVGKKMMWHWSYRNSYVLPFLYSAVSPERNVRSLQDRKRPVILTVHRTDAPLLPSPHAWCSLEPSNA